MSKTVTHKMVSTVKGHMRQPIIGFKACADQFRGSLSQSVRLDMLWSNWGYREFNWMEQPQARSHTINCVISELRLHAGSILTMFSG